MRIPLDSFESYIDETILKRGLDYWRKGYVEPPEEISAGEWEASVQGTEEYTVKFHVKSGVVTDYSCDCPYDLGPVCKHVVAALFAMQEERLADFRTSKKEKKTGEKSASRKPGEKDQQEELLKRLTKDDLAGFIRQAGDSDKNFRRMFIAHFSNLLDNYGSENYAKYIRGILKTAAGREGFLHYRSAVTAAKQVDELQAKAMKHLDSGNFEPAFQISMAVLNEMEEALNYADDSNGSIGGCLSNAVDLLYRIAESKIPDSFRREMFSQALGHACKSGYHGWDWQMDMVQLAANLVANPEELNSFYSAIGKMNFSEYALGDVARIRIELTRRFEGAGAAEKYSESLLHLPEIRRVASEQAFSRKDYDKVNQLAEDGIKLARQKNHPGLVNEWVEWKLKVSQARKDKAEILRIAHRLFIDGHHEMKYFDLMQKQVEPNQWPGIVQQVIRDLTENGKARWWPIETLARIYIQEEMWKELLAALSKKPSLSQLEAYDKHLIKFYPAELSQLYEEAVCEQADNSMGRNHYQTTARYLRRMKKLGFDQAVDLIVKELKNKYVKRRALLEELDKI